MNHYANLATLGFRLFAASLLFCGVVSLLYSAFVMYVLNKLEGSEYLFGGCIYVCSGIIAFAVSRIVGKLLAKGLSD